MAIRFSGTGQSFSSTSGLPTTRLFTITCWVQLVSDRNAVTCFWSIDSSSTEFSWLGTDGTGVGLVFDWPGGGASYTYGPTLVVGTWYKVALVVNGTSADIYAAPAGAGLTFYDEGANYNLPSGTLTFRLGYGTITGADSWPDARIAAVKMWDAALTQSEVDRELQTYIPRRTVNLNRWHPLVNGEPVDYSGNGRTLTGGVGASVEGGPPIPWTAARNLIIPWDPATVVWYAHYDTTSGELLSLGTVEPDPLPTGTAVLELLNQPNQALYEWSTTARVFVPREGFDTVDRVEDMVADASLASVWATLDATQDQALKDRIGQLLGSHRYRLSFQNPDLD